MNKPGEPGIRTLDIWNTADPIEPGDVCFSTTGRRYLVVAARGPSRRPDGCLRWHLDTVVMTPEDEPPIGARAWHFSWHRRTRSTPNARTKR